MELVKEHQKFWNTLKMSVMNRQQGLSWADVGAMPINDFLHVLSISEQANKSEQPVKLPARGGRKAKSF